MGKRLLRVRVDGELWRAVHIEALSRGVYVGAIIEDALRLYFALAQGNVSLATKPGVSLNLTTVKPSIATAQCGQAKEPTPVGAKGPEPQPQPAAIVDADAPSFVKDNPWLAIIARRNGG